MSDALLSLLARGAGAMNRSPTYRRGTCQT